MGELWWAEAVIAADQTPDWDAARATIGSLGPDDIPDFQDYINELPEEALRASHPEAAEALFAPASAERDTLLLRYVRLLVRHDLDALIEVLQAGRPHVCAFEAEGMRVYVHCSGYGSSPDKLCDIWLRIDNMGLLQAAGFVETGVLDGGC
jgi:hypothetical protein